MSYLEKEVVYYVGCVFLVLASSIYINENCTLHCALGVTLVQI